MPGRIGVSKHNLPTFLTSFVGRDSEIREICDLLTASRLVTLVGPPGVGKARLALEVAGRLTDRYADGLWWVDLSALSDPDSILEALCAAIGLRDEPGRASRLVLRAFLRSRTALFVLENCEHCAAACADIVGDLLGETTDLRVLASSRLSLGLAEEQTYSVAPLSVPPAESLPVTTMSLLSHEAVRLFAERAAVALPAFRLTVENGETVARICRRLDGMPLAIEFAAAWCRFMSVQEIDARLAAGARLPVPDRPPQRPGAPPDTLQWRFSLLSAEERVLLRRLAAFVGGWNITAAETVCAGGAIRSPDIPDMIGEFVDQSLAVREVRNGQIRCRLPAAVRARGREWLLQAEEAAEVFRRHREFFLAMVERAGQEINSSRQAEVAASLDLEYDNLRAALESFRDCGDTVGGLRMAAALLPYWELRGQFAAGSRWLTSLLAADGAAPGPVRGSALFAAAVLLHRQGDLKESEDALVDSLALLRKHDDRRAVARALSFLAAIRVEQGKYGTAEREWVEALGLMREAGDERGAALCLHHLGFVASLRGQLRRSADLNTESLRILRRTGPPGSVARVLQSLATTALNLGHYGRAASLCEESLTIRRALGDALGMAEASWGVGRLAALQGDCARAQTALQEALSLAVGCGATRWVILAKVALGELALDEADFVAARDLLAQSLEAARASGHEGLVAQALVPMAELAICQREYQRAAALLGEAAGFFIKSGRRHGLARCLERFARMASEQGDHARAVPLLAKASAIREHTGAVLFPRERSLVDRAVQAARKAVGEGRFAALWIHGRRLADEAAIRFALGRGPARPVYPANLSGREVEVLRLLALGASVSRVAADLTISPHTAKRHVANIYGKLGVASRHDATLRAHELGIV
ncbi:MAG: LuxR C-terminal-related transcriptional regulator [Armatimonadota bacterium]|nr:LuxR C-terminal-related transcriptional regulator [Armatimonadota bacterium]